PSRRSPPRWRSRGHPAPATHTARPPRRRRGRPSAPGASGADVEIPLRLGTRAVPVQLVTDGDGFAATVDGGTHPVVCVATGPRAHAAGGMVVEELALEVDGQARR